MWTVISPRVVPQCCCQCCPVRPPAAQWLCLRERRTTPSDPGGIRSDAIAMRAARHDLGDGACFNIECTSKNSKQPRTKLTSFSHEHAGSFYQEPSPNAVASAAQCGQLLHNGFACEKGEPPHKALEVLGAMQWQCVLLGMILVSW